MPLTSLKSHDHPQTQKKKKKRGLTGFSLANPNLSEIALSVGSFHTV
jgi:hypothetical protein